MSKHKPHGKRRKHKSKHEQDHDAQESAAPAAAEPLFEFDRKVRDTFVPHHRHPGIKALKWFGGIGDQPQLRLLSLGVLVLGLARSDERMVRAGTRMLLSHEVATIAKNAVKHSVDRRRPRSVDGEKDHKPKPGNTNTKEETSFPSGHSAGSLAVASAFASEYPQFTAPALATAAAVGAVQVPTCAHYPSDVVAGWAIGGLSSAAVGLAWRALFSVIQPNGSSSELFGRN